MKNEQTATGRREFLSGAGLAVLALATGGCANALKISGGGTMSGYVVPKLKRIRVGVVGVGSRGTYALRRLAFMPGVDIAAFCDIKESAMKPLGIVTIDLAKMDLSNAGVAGPQQTIGQSRE